jgi:hypothetical protein
VIDIGGATSCNHLINVSSQRSRPSEDILLAGLFGLSPLAVFHLTPLFLLVRQTGLGSCKLSSPLDILRRPLSGVHVKLDRL